MKLEDYYKNATEFDVQTTIYPRSPNFVYQKDYYENVPMVCRLKLDVALYDQKRAVSLMEAYTEEMLGGWNEILTQTLKHKMKR